MGVAKRGEDGPNTVSMTEYYYPTGVATPTPYTYPGYGDHSYYTGITTTDFAARKKRGDLIPYTQFHQAFGECDHAAVTRSWKRVADGKTGKRVNAMGTSYTIDWRLQDQQDHSAVLDISPSELDRAYYHLQSAAAKIYSQGHDTLTFLSELGKTRKMFQQVGGKIVNITRGLSPNKIAKYWLEGRYGWRTLAYDLNDLHHAVTEFDYRRRIYSERSGSSYEESETDTQVGSKVDGFNLALYRTSNVTYSLRGSVAALFTPARFSFNPVVTAWELVPFSFVVDWVYDVGTAIEAASFMMTMSKYTASIGYKVDYDITFTEVASSNAQYSDVTGDVSYRYIGTVVNRTPTSITNLAPRLTYQRLSNAKLADLAALALVRLKLGK